VVRGTTLLVGFRRWDLIFDPLLVDFDDFNTGIDTCNRTATHFWQKRSENTVRGRFEFKNSNRSFKVSRNRPLAKFGCWPISRLDPLLLFSILPSFQMALDLLCTASSNIGDRKESASLL
jgi:hypothetical protein